METTAPTPKENEDMPLRIANAIRQSLWQEDFRMLVVFLPGREKVSIRMLDATDLGSLLRNLQNQP